MFALGFYSTREIFGDDLDKFSYFGGGRTGLRVKRRIRRLRLRLREVNVKENVGYLRGGGVVTFPLVVTFTLHLVGHLLRLVSNKWVALAVIWLFILVLLVVLLL